MSEQNTEVRADPAFKLITNQIAQELSLKVIGAELPQTLTADLVLEIPSDISPKLEDSLFSFLIGYEYAVIEFKGQNDRFTLPKFLTNLARIALFCLKRPEVEVGKVLNLFVCSRYPQEILGLANPTPEQASFRNTAQEPWVWRASFFFQEIMIVICRDLPLEPRYYQWLLFAPADTQKWREFVKTALREGRRDLVASLRSLRPKEFNEMQIDVNEILSQLDPKERKRLNKDWAEVMEEKLPEMANEEPDELLELFDNFLSKITPTQRIRFLQSLKVDDQTDSKYLISAKAVRGKFSQFWCKSADWSGCREW